MLLLFFFSVFQVFVIYSINSIGNYAIKVKNTCVLFGKECLLESYIYDEQCVVCHVLSNIVANLENLVSLCV